MLRRPLVLVLFFFAGGILLGNFAAPHRQGLILPLLLSLGLVLGATLFVPHQIKKWTFLLCFFLSGLFLYLLSIPSSSLLPIATEGHRVVLEGSILEPPKLRENGIKVVVRVHAIIAEQESRELHEDMLLTIQGPDRAFGTGDRIRFSVRLRPLQNFNNPGGYDYVSSMARKGIFCSATVSEGRQVVSMGGRPPPLRGFLDGIQRPIRDFFRRHLHNENHALFKALILGEQEEISQLLREPFNQTGLGHILSVSGLHISLVAGGAFFFFRWVLSQSHSLMLTTNIRLMAGIMACIPAIGYALVAGFQVASQRAMIMALAFFGSLILGRDREIWTTLALAGLFVLSLDPGALFSISFQLSFLGVVGILWLMPALWNRIYPRSQQEMRSFAQRSLSYVMGLLLVSLSATLFLFPVLCYYFNRIPVLTLPANMSVVPLVGFWVIPLGLLSIVTLPLNEAVASFFLSIGSYGLDGMMMMTRFWAQWSWSSLWIFTPNLMEIALYYVLLFCLFHLKKTLWAKLGAAAVCLTLFADATYWVLRVHYPKDLRVTYLDVGKGNAALVQFPGGEKMLVDSGGFARGDFDIGQMVIAPFLWSSKICKVDYLVLSHPEADHMNGFSFIAKAFHPSEFWFNGDQSEDPSFHELMAILDKKSIPKLTPHELREGRSLHGVKIEILYPDPPGLGPLPVKRMSLNNRSLVLKMSFGGWSFLFPGDLEEAGEAALISKAGDRVQSQVLLCPHHGAQRSCTLPFLQAVRPRYCIISSGKGSSAFPHNNTLERLANIGSEVFRMDQAGAVQFRVGPHHLKITTFLEKDNQRNASEE